MRSCQVTGDRSGNVLRLFKYRIQHCVVAESHITLCLASRYAPTGSVDLKNHKFLEPPKHIAELEKAECRIINPVNVPGSADR